MGTPANVRGRAPAPPLRAVSAGPSPRTGLRCLRTLPRSHRPVSRRRRERGTVRVVLPDLQPSLPDPLDRAAGAERTRSSRGAAAHPRLRLPDLCGWREGLGNHALRSRLQTDAHYSRGVPATRGRGSLLLDLAELRVATEGR